MMTLQQAFISFLQSNEISGVSNFRHIDAKFTFFSYQEINFLYVYESDDPTVFHLIVPKIEEYSKDLEGKMLDFTMRYKIAKVIKVDNSIWLSFEQIVFNQKEGDYRLFKLAIKILTSMIREWRGVVDQTTNES